VLLEAEFRNRKEKVLAAGLLPLDGARLIDKRDPKRGRITERQTKVERFARGLKCFPNNFWKLRRVIYIEGGTLQGFWFWPGLRILAPRLVVSPVRQLPCPKILSSSRVETEYYLGMSTDSFHPGTNFPLTVKCGVYQEGP